MASALDSIDCDRCRPALHVGCQDPKTGGHYRCSIHR